MRILVLCTGNRCRSQMTEGWLRRFAPDWTVASAGINPAQEVHPLAKIVMEEVGIDINNALPKSVFQFTEDPWDYVITVCGNAEKTCPVFAGEVGKRLHIGFDDPDAFVGSDEEVLKEFRRVRDEIGQKMSAFASEIK
ncbi:MAG: arsenate reductase ArsC [Bacteroidales bacterium]|nr:arsenate reductase ArsC [Bacteroidales bacterium]